MSRTVLAFLLLVAASAASLTDSQSRQHVEASRLIRAESEHEGSDISSVELTPGGKLRQDAEEQVTKEIEDHLPDDLGGIDGILMTYGDKKNDVASASAAAVSDSASTPVFTPASDEIVMTYGDQGKHDASKVGAAHSGKAKHKHHKHHKHKTAEKAPKGNGISMTYEDNTDATKAADTKAADSVKLPAGIVIMADQVKSSKIVEDGDNKAEVNPFIPTKALLGHPVGPCIWMLEIARKEKGGEPKTWATMKVNGTKDEKFYFKGCTTTGEEAGYCLRAQGISSGVSVMWNRAGQVVQFGSCCKPDLTDVIVNSRMQHCEEPAPVKEAVTSTWSDLMRQQSPTLSLLELIAAGTFLMVIISFFMYYRFKK